MTTVSLDEAEKNLPLLLERAHSEEVSIMNNNGEKFLLLSLRPKTREEREAAWVRAESLSKVASEMLEKNLAKDGITVEQFLADALADD